MSKPTEAIEARTLPPPRKAGVRTPAFPGGAKTGHLPPVAIARLMAWFDANHRPLPFRQSRDAYRIWVSEVMLQQTTVTAVIPYFTRFLDRFPTVTALAQASESDVLAIWEGLGYYRRAKHLHAAAKRLAVDFGNDLPDDPVYWAELPGVGRYILGAVLSQAFERKLPIVEANTLRVLTRLFGYRDDPRASAGQKWLWERAEAILPTSRVGDFNQAMMELGATICKLDSPNCRACPLNRNCMAKRVGSTDRIPLRPIKSLLTPMRTVILIAHRRHQVLLGLRPDSGRWAGMWEFPQGEMVGKETVTTASKRVARQLLNVETSIIETWPESVQTVTRFVITSTPVVVTLKGRVKSSFYDEVKWIDLDDAASLPMPVMQRTLLNQIKDM